MSRSPHQHITDRSHQSLLTPRNSIGSRHPESDIAIPFDPLPKHTIQRIRLNVAQCTAGTLGPNDGIPGEGRVPLERDNQPVALCSRDLAATHYPADT